MRRALPLVCVLVACNQAVEPAPSPALTPASTCQAGVTRCAGTVLEQCRGAWAKVTDCDAAGLTCGVEPLTGIAACLVPECDAPTQCEGDILVSCVAGQASRVDCGVRGQRCAEPMGIAVCAAKPSCEDGYMRCSQESVHACVGGLWETLAACDAGELCQSASRYLAECVPAAVCAAQDTRCRGDSLQYCTGSAWLTLTVCDCVEDGGVPACDTQEECESGAKRCQVDTLQRCQHNRWVTAENCSSRGLVCDANTLACIGESVCAGLDEAWTCDGTAMVHCQGGQELEALDCATLDGGDLPARGTCVDLGAELGAWCTMPAGNACYFETTDGTPVAFACGTPTPAPPGTMACDPLGGCVPFSGACAPQTCSGDRMVVDCLAMGSYTLPYVWTCSDPAIGGVCQNGHCREADVGALCLADYIDCSAGLGCTDPAGGTCAVSCVNECGTEGTTRCNGGLLDRCARQASGCLAWQYQQPCSSGFCGSQTSCGTCSHACAVGQKSCADGVLKSCSTDAQGCRAWVESSCSDGFCASTTSCGQCTHQCSAVGLSECTSGNVRTCQSDAHDCRAWSAQSACASGVCEGSRCADSCDPNLQSACAPSCAGLCGNDIKGTWRNQAAGPSHLRVLALKTDATFVGRQGEQELSGTWESDRPRLTLHVLGGTTHRYSVQQDDDAASFVEVDAQWRPVVPPVAFSMSKTTPGYCHADDDCRFQPLPNNRLFGAWQCSAKRVCSFDADPICHDVANSHQVAPMQTQGAPAARKYHSAVWMGAEMVVWGGRGDVGLLADGGAYDASQNSWRTIATAGAPSARVTHLALWTGTEMAILGGDGDSPGWLFDGGLYNPSTNRWSTIAPCTACNVLKPFAQLLWDGSRLIAWQSGVVGGAVYDISTRSWSLLPGINWEGWGAPRYAGSELTTLHDGNLLTFMKYGWESGSTPYKVTALLSLTTLQWQELSEDQAPWHAYNGDTMGGRLVVFTPQGGNWWDPQGGIHGATYDPYADLWRAIPTGPNNNFPETVAAGERFLKCRGRETTTDTFATWCVTYDPHAQVWSAPVQLAERSRTQGTMVWAEDRALLFGGEERYRVGGQEFSHLSTAGVVYTPPRCE